MSIVKTEIGKYFLDISKLVFGGTVLSAIVGQNIEFWWLVLSGAIIAILSAVTGFFFLSNPPK